MINREGPDRGLSLRGATGVPSLLISGSSGELTDQTRLLTSSLSPLAVGPKAVAGLPESTAGLPGSTTTLRDLGQSGLTGTALAPKVSIGLDQTRWGKSVHGLRVHLQGSYSPLQANSGGQIVATVGAETIDQWPADDTGVINRSVDIPDRLLRRYTNLGVQLNVADNTGRCGDFHTPGAGDRLLTLSIGDDSTVQSSPADPPAPGGLASMPQSLTPHVNVGIESNAWDDTANAVGVMVGLQRVSAPPIVTAVMSAQQAIDSPDPAVLVSSSGWSHGKIPLPVSSSPDGPITVNAFNSDGKSATLAIDPALKFASLQAIFDGKRSLLIATSNGAPGQLGELLQWLDSDRGRWIGINGTAVVSALGRDPVTVNTTASGRPTPGEGSPEGEWVWWVGGGLLAVAAVAVATVLGRRRHRAQGG